MDNHIKKELMESFWKINNSKKGYIDNRDLYLYNLFLIYLSRRLIKDNYLKLGLARGKDKLILNSNDIEKYVNNSLNSDNNSKEFNEALDKNKKLFLESIKDNNISEELLLIEKLSKFETEEILKFLFEENWGLVSPNYAQYSEATPMSICYLANEIFGKNKENVEFLDAFSGIGTIGINYYLYNNNSNITALDINIVSHKVALWLSAIADENRFNCITDDFYKVQNNNKEYEDKKYDFIFADVPLGLQYDKSLIKMIEDKYDNFILGEKKISSPWLAAIKTINLLKENGKAIVVCTEASLFNVLDQNIRKQFIEQKYIEQIIKLPAKLLQYTGISIYFIVLSKRKNNSISFVDISNCIDNRGRYNAIDIDMAKTNFKDISVKVSLEEVIENEYSLDVNRYLNKDKIYIENGVSLADVTEEIFRGYQITGSQVDKMLTKKISDTTCNLLEISDIDNEGNISKHLKVIDTEGKDFSKFLLHDGDILLSARGENTKIAIANLKNNEKIIPNGSIVVIRTNKEKLNPKYLLIFLNSKQGQLILKTIKTGITIPSLNIGPLEKMTIKCPAIDEQDTMAEKYEMKLELYKIAKVKVEKLKQQLEDITNEI